MTRGVNKAIILGYLGADPEVRYMPNGNAVANIRVATTETWRDRQSGERQERTEWHRVVLYRRLAEIAGEYLKKGSQVFIEGRIQTRKWQGNDGQERWTTEVVANEMNMIGGRGGGSGADFQSGPPEPPQDDWGAPPSGQTASPAPQSASQPAPSSPSKPTDDFDDDIPF